ncbi:MAG: tetratricopeptide repeat protein [Bacteroidales bacterium]|nr:tetratricopeptide repeat protein [Bacteroidales bacterium]
MKLRVLAILGGILLAGSLSAQTLTDVINEFNIGVEKLNNQEYEVSVEHFSQVLVLAEAVGDSATDMRTQAEKLIPSAYYRQATVFMKRKQYDNAIPYLETTVETATLYGNNEEIKAKAMNYLPPLYVREGNRAWKNKAFDDAHANFDKALALKESLYQAHQGKGMVFLEQDETEMMLEEFKLAKEGAMAKNDTKTISKINGVVDSYYNKFITEELEMVDPEDNDYTYVIEASENALAANPENSRALYHLALVRNKVIDYDAAVDYALKALQYESEPVWISAINFELGQAYQNSVEYDKACEAFKNVIEEPFLTRAEKKMGSIPGCN